MPAFITRLAGSAFVRNIVVVMSGTAAAQAVGFALSPVLSRLFSPTDFGVYGSFDAIATVIAAGATLDYAQALMLPKKTEDAANILTLSCLCSGAIAACCLLFCVVAPGTVRRAIGVQGSWPLILLVLTTLVSGLNQSFQAWCVRRKAFKNTAASQVIRSISAGGTQIGLGWLRLGAPGLAVGSVFADLLASANLFRPVLADLRNLRSSISVVRIKQMAREYIDFPLYSASMNVINALSRGVPVLLLSRFYGIGVAGAYAFAVRVLQAPMRFVLTALRQVLFQRYSEAAHEGSRLFPLYMRTTVGLAALALVPIVLFLLWAPPIFVFVFGAQWQLAGEFSRSLVLWLAFLFCNLPATLFGRILRMQRRLFVIDIILLVARVLTLVIGGMSMTSTTTVVLFSLVGVSANIALIAMIGVALLRADRKRGSNGEAPPEAMAR